MILRINDRIRNKQIDFFDKVNVSLRYDSIASAFSFVGYFNHENAEHKDIYCVGHYHKATLEHNNERLLHGYILSENFDDSKSVSPVSISGYSLPGVLEDCQIPTSLYPLQSDGLTLREIATKLIAPFGLKMIVDPLVSSEMDKVYDKTTADASQSIKGYLQELASQRNVIISHTVDGAIYFTRARINAKPILNYGGDGLPCPKMSFQFDGQGMHSHITVIKQPSKDGDNAAETTIKNPYVPFVYRPKVVVQNSGDDIDTDQAAKNVLSEELKNLKLTFTTDRWEIDGTIIKPNNIITVLNPRVYLYKRTEWFIEQVDYTGDTKGLTATLTCVLPEVYNNKTPKYIFEGINLH